MENTNLKKPEMKIKIHKIYLLASAALVLSGIITGMNMYGFTTLLYLTFLSNIFLAAYFFLSFFLYGKKEVLKSYLLMSVIIAISITALVYNFVIVPFADVAPVFSMNMSFAWNFQNSMTHLFSMLLILANYFIFEKKGLFKIKHVLVSTIFPLLYWLVFITIGSIINFYPYFFMDVPAIGWGMTILWLIIFISVFSFLGFLLFIIDRAMGKKQSTS